MTPNLALTRFQIQILSAAGAFLVVSFSLLFSWLFLEPIEDLTLRTKTRVADVLQSLVAYEKDHGVDELIRFVEDSVIWQDSDAPFVSIKDAAGGTLLHTSPEISPDKAWAASDLSIRALPVGWGLSRRWVHVAAAPLKEGRLLLIGQSEVKAAQRHDRAVIGFAALSSALLILVILAAALLSHRSRQRVDEMASTLFAFTAGEVDRRVPMSNHSERLSDLALAINNALDYAQRLLWNLNYLSADIAHNLKKPLTRLRQRLELVSKCEFTNPDLSHKIDEGLQEIDSLVVIFEALLNISQLQSGEQRSRFVDVDLPGLLSHIADVYEPIITDNEQQLELIIPTEGLRPVKGDRELLMEMTVNFVDNAIQYCPPGTLIRLGLQRVQTGIDLFISDNGPGVAPSQIPNLFERFYRLEVSREKSGHGLGIPFAVAIAELHGAHVELCDNKPGLNVVIHFPDRPTSRSQLGLRLRSGRIIAPRSPKA